MTVMNDEEKKALAAQYGISVEDLEKGIADGSISVGGDQQQTPPPVQATPPVQSQQTQTETIPESPSYDEAKKSAQQGVSGSRKKLLDANINAAEGMAGVYKRKSERDSTAAMGEINSIRGAMDALDKKSEEITQKNIEANNTYRAAVEAANKAQEESNNTILQRYISDAELARKENEVMGKAERKAAMWTGATEFGAALANLLGVSFGAENQQIKPYSENWMQRADQNRKDRIRRMDSLNDRRSALEQQIAALKTSGLKELAAADLNNERYKNDREEAALNRRAETTRAIAGMVKEKEMAESANTAQAEAALWGGLKEGSSAANAPRGGGGGGGYRTPAGVPRNAYPLSLNGRSYWVDDRSVIRNVQAHRNQFDSQTQTEVNEILNNERMRESEKALALLQYVEDSPSVMDAIIRSSYGEYNGNNGGNNNGNGGQSQASSFFGN